MQKNLLTNAEIFIQLVRFEVQPALLHRKFSNDIYSKYAMLKQSTKNLVYFTQTFSLPIPIH